jgi:predicted dehydrogenase
MNQGIHFVDVLEWLMGPTERVFGRCATAAHEIEVEDVAAAILTFRGGAIGVVQASTAAYPGLPWRLQVTGTKGTVLIEDSRIKVCEIAGEESAIELGGDHDARSVTGASDPASIFHLGHRDQFADYLHALQVGDEPPIGGADGRRALEVVLAVYASARSGREVELGTRAATTAR